jgi:hypothetical protein
VRPQPLHGIYKTVQLQPRQVMSVEAARKQLEETTLRWQEAVEAGQDTGVVRILKSYVEGAGVNLQFARTMGDIEELHLPVTVFSFSGLSFFTVPGELFSTLAPEGLCPITYANGYYRYIADKEAYDKGYYEAMAAIVARGAGEYLMEQVLRMTEEIQ